MTVLVNPTTYEFDVYFKRTGALPFETYGLQLALLFNDSIRNGGTLTATYIAGTSGMLTAQIPNNPNIAAVVGSKRIFKLAGKIPAGPGQGTLLDTTGNGTKLGRFRIALTGATEFLRNQQLILHGTLINQPGDMQQRLLLMLAVSLLILQHSQVT